MPIFLLYCIVILEHLLTKSLGNEEPFKKIRVADELCCYWTLELIITLLGKRPRKIPLTLAAVQFRCYEMLQKQLWSPIGHYHPPASKACLL